MIALDRQSCIVHLLFVYTFAKCILSANRTTKPGQEMDEKTEQLYREAFEAMRQRRQVTESRVATLCVLGGAVMAGVMALAVWVGAAIGGGV